MLRNALICCSLFFAATAATTATRAAFDDFIAAHGKRYNSTEYERRLSVFEQTLKIIDERNAMGEAEHGVNKFADLTQEEFRQRYLGYLPGATASSKDELDIPLTNSSDIGSIDWRGHSPPVLTAVKNQAQCGSCWAFSATEQIESDYALAGNPLQRLSVQQIVSCDKQDAGCNGGKTETAYDYVQKAGGLELGEDYPYHSGGGSRGTCKADLSKVAVKINGYNTISKTELGEKKMVTKIADGPLSVCVDASIWQTYKSGIVGKTCKKKLDHCVQAVGLNTDAGKTYWIVRNSWAEDWGQGGYIYVQEGINACGIAKDVTTAQVA